MTTPLIDEPVLKELAAKHKKTVAQILLRNLMQRGIIVLPKSVTKERIISNFQVSVAVSDIVVAICQFSEQQN